MRRFGLRRAFVPVLILLFALPALAAEGRIPVFAPGSVLVADGKYILTRNLIGPGPVLTICGPNVDLDLNGMLVLETAGGVGIAVGGPFCPGPLADHTVIKNGFVSGILGGGAGIDAPGPMRKIDIEDVKLHDHGPPASIHLGDVLEAAIRRVEIIDNPTAPGILWDGPGVTKSGAIENSLIRQTGDGIILTSRCSSVGVVHNRLDNLGFVGGGGGFGIVLANCAGSLVMENTIETCRTEGIFLVSQSHGNKLFDNVVRDCDSHGIHISRDSQDNLVLNNVSTSNGAAAGIWADGILVEGPLNKVDGNLVNSNTGVGLQFCAPLACGNTLSGNTGRANGGVVGPCGCVAPPFPAAALPDICNNPAACGIPNTSAGHNVFALAPVF